MVLNITVKTLDSQDYQFEANDDWTVRQFKQHIQDTVNAPPDQQRLIFCGRVLEDDKKLVEYDCNGSAIHLVRWPTPTLLNLGPSSANSSADTSNNNNQNVYGADGNIRFLDENNVLFSAMTLGPEANVQHILRHMVTLQQAIVTRTLNDGTAISTTIEPTYMTEIDRHLYNASRLLRITVNTVNEFMARVAALPIPTGSTSSHASNGSENSSRQIISSASSHTDLQMDDTMLASDRETDEPQAADYHPSAPVAGLDVGSTSLNTSSSSDRVTRINLPRQSLTTDDLPQTGSVGSTDSSQQSAASTSQGLRLLASIPVRRSGETHLDRYLAILNYSCDVQNQFQGLVRRYRQFIDISRRGGLIVTPNASAENAATSDTNTTDSSEHREENSEPSASGEDQASSSPEQTTPNQSRPISSAMMEEARLLGSYIPRIMHHLGHLQHALSDFSIDFTRGRLLVCGGRSHHRGRSSSRTSQGSSSDGTRAQSQTLQHRRPPLTRTVPVITPRGASTIRITTPTLDLSQLNALLRPVNPNVEESRPQQQQQEQQNPSPSRPQPQQATNSTQTTNRPIGVISGRIPLPFDYYLPCLSPWIPMGYNSSDRIPTGESVSATIHLRGSRPESQSASANVDRAEDNQTATNTTSNDNVQATPIVMDFGLTEVVSNIVGSMFRPSPRTQSQQNDQQPSQQQQQSQASASQQGQDQILNIIPELALNAVSQILGGVLGTSNTNSSSATATTNNQQEQTATASTTSTVMMDIDIDDGSSTQSELRYQDARETSSPLTATATIQPQRPTITLHTPIPQAGHSRDSISSSHHPSQIRYDRERLAQAMQSNPEWIPIIEADISIMNQQQASSRGVQPFFSDAYLSSIPRKRRRLLTASPDRVPILQPQPSQAITNILRRAIINSSTSTNSDSLDQILDSISTDEDLHRAYEDYLRSAVEVRLKSDYDYSPSKFINSSKYFK